MSNRSANTPQPPERVLVLINRGSRSGDSELDGALDRLRQSGMELETHRHDGPQKFPALIKDNRDKVDAVILGGGDGTMNCAAGALREAGLPLGILPLGTANDLARTLEIPDDLAAACELIAQGHTRTVDLGQVNDVYFFNAASIGLGVKVTQRLSSDIKQGWGVLGYARSAADALRAARWFTAEVTSDGESQRIRCMHITVGNGRYYGGGMTVSADAAIDDGRLDMYALKPQKFWHLLTLAAPLRFGPKGEENNVMTFHGQTITINTSKSRSVSTDGEITTRTPAEFKVHPRAISIYSPA